MVIGIDGRTLQDAEYSGVPEYTSNILDEIFKLDSQNKYQLFYNSSHDIYSRLPKFDYENVASEKFDYPNKLLNYGLLKPFGRPFFDKLLGGCDAFFMPHINFVGLSDKCQLTLTIHDLSFLRFPEFFSWRKNFWHKQLNIGKLIRRADKLVAISENTKKDLIELFDVPAEKISVIYSGINSSFKIIEAKSADLLSVKRKYNLPDEFLLYLGTVEPRKNIDGLIKAFNEVKRLRQDNLQLVIAGGKGWKSAAVNNAYENSPYKSDISFLGYIDQADKPALYNLAKLFVFPSYYEGFGFPPLEAMACGLPVVASHASSLSEILGNAAILIDPYSQSQLVAAITEGLDNQALRQRLQAAGFKNVRLYDWPQAAQKYLEVFKK